MTLSEFLSKLKGVKRCGDGYIAYCPGHEDRGKRSLSIREGDDGRILLNCFAGCTAERICGAMGVGVKDLFAAKASAPAGKKSRALDKADSSPASKPLTLRELAAAKKLPVDFLYDLGVEDHPDGLGVLIGYFDREGRQRGRHRLRTALRAKDGSTWWPARGESPGIYGEWRVK